MNDGIKCSNVLLLTKRNASQLVFRKDIQKIPNSQCGYTLSEHSAQTKKFPQNGKGVWIQSGLFGNTIIQFHGKKCIRDSLRTKKKHKTTNVPRNHQGHLKLGQWVNHQRTNYKSKKLSIERVNCLDSIGFVWDALDSKWMEMYSKLVEYKKQNKSTRVPHYYTEDLSFGMWVYNQRFAYNKGNLSGKRLKLLNSISFAAS